MQHVQLMPRSAATRESLKTHSVDTCKSSIAELESLLSQRFEDVGGLD